MKTNTNVIIGDTRKMTMIWKEDREWLIKEWYPKAIEAGFRCVALVITSDSYNELALKEVVEKSDGHMIETKYFISPSNAENWVKDKVLEIVKSR